MRNSERGGAGEGDDGRGGIYNGDATSGHSAISTHIYFLVGEGVGSDVIGIDRS